MKLLQIMALSFLLLLSAIQVRAADLTVSAAASLTNSFTEIKNALEKMHPDIKISTNYASSNQLLQQMREGAPVDIFASADQETMDKAQAEKLINLATRRDFVANGLVLIVPINEKNPDFIKNSSDLDKADKLAIGNPDSVPAGRYARASLQSIGQWEKLQPKFVLGESVRQVLDYVSRGEVDAGFVYSTDAAIARNKVAVKETMSGHKPILYPIAITATCKEKSAAQEFMNFLSGQEGRAILKKYGFVVLD